MSKNWDLTSLRSLDAAAEWIRSGSAACLVLVVRGEDVAFAVDPAIRPADALTMVEVAMPEVVARLEDRREDARLKAQREQQKAAAEAALQKERGTR